MPDNKATTLDGTPAEGFAPLFSPDARALVLGTLPSVRSLAASQYYGHPQNAFWPMMSALLGFASDMPYAQRCQALVQHKVAVWDVLAAAVREGSLDSAIERNSERANPIATLLAAMPQCRVIAFNGRAAEKLFRRHIMPTADASLLALPTLTLPSTSPAYAAMPRAQKQAQWAALLPYIE